MAVLEQNNLSWYSDPAHFGQRKGLGHRGMVIFSFIFRLMLIRTEAVTEIPVHFHAFHLRLDWVAVLKALRARLKVLIGEEEPPPPPPPHASGAPRRQQRPTLPVHRLVREGGHPALEGLHEAHPSGFLAVRRPLRPFRRPF